MFGQNVTEHNPAPSPSGHPLLSGPPTLTIFTRYSPWAFFSADGFVMTLAEVHYAKALSDLGICCLAGAREFHRVVPRSK